MPSDFWFRLRTYLALALSCACLGYAEWEVLPEVTAFTGLVILLLAASFLLNRRFELGLGKANLLGLGIGVLAAVWMTYNISRPHRTIPHRSFVEDAAAHILAAAGFNGRPMQTNNLFATALLKSGT